MLLKFSTLRNATLIICSLLFLSACGDGFESASKQLNARSPNQLSSLSSMSRANSVKTTVAGTQALLGGFEALYAPSLNGDSLYLGGWMTPADHQVGDDRLYRSVFSRRFLATAETTPMDQCRIRARLCARLSCQRSFCYQSAGCSVAIYVLYGTSKWVRGHIYQYGELQPSWLSSEHRWRSQLAKSWSCNRAKQWSRFHRCLGALGFDRQ